MRLLLRFLSMLFIVSSVCLLSGPCFSASDISCTREPWPAASSQESSRPVLLSCWDLGVEPSDPAMLLKSTLLHTTAAANFETTACYVCCRHAYQAQRLNGNLIAIYKEQCSNGLHAHTDVQSSFTATVRRLFCLCGRGLLGARGPSRLAVF